MARIAADCNAEMASRHILFGVFYRIGFTPSDGHALGQSLRDLVKGTDDTPALATGSALDVGCGTGDSSIYLSQHGWTVTAVDFVPQALDKAGAAGCRSPSSTRTSRIKIEPVLMRSSRTSVSPAFCSLALCKTRCSVALPRYDSNLRVTRCWPDDSGSR
jgi:SAM-dependent methyltransferase